MRKVAVECGAVLVAQFSNAAGKRDVGEIATLLRRALGEDIEFSIEAPPGVPLAIADAAQLEAYNQQIAVMLAADPCHNIDRIMRLPGTLNIVRRQRS